MRIVPLPRDREGEHTFGCAICDHELRMTFAEMVEVEGWADGLEWTPICGDHMGLTEPPPNAPRAMTS